MNEAVLRALRAHSIIAILRGIPPQSAADTARALYEGGIRLLEVTFEQSSPSRLSDTAQSIERIRETLAGGALVGAGTVLTPEEAETAAAAGAAFVLAPDIHPPMIEAALRRGMAVIPGAMTPTEIVTAHRLGAAAVKVFPCGSLGPAYIRAVAAPLSHIPLIAVGGVDEHNLADFLQAGALAVGIGSSMVNHAWVKAGRFDELTRLALRYTQAARR